MRSGRGRRRFARGGGGSPFWLLTGREGNSAVHDKSRCAALILVVAAAAAACMAVAASASASASAAQARPAGAAWRLATGNPWGKAQEVPGLAAFSKGHETEIASVSCASAGNCSAGGDYTVGSVGSFRQEAFAVSEVHGRWRKPEEVTGKLDIAALNTGGDAGITSVSCASAGNCSAGGDYSGRGGHAEVFVVGEVHSRWRKAEEVPGTAALNTGGDAQMISVSCGSAGNCSAGGNYAAGLTGDGEPGSQPFVVSEVRGRWRKAEEVPGTAALNIGGEAQITSMSCASPGNCSMGGDYEDAPYDTRPFVVSEVSGTWREAEEVPGIANLNKGNPAVITSLSCGSAGHCSAVGSYTVVRSSGRPRSEAFVVSRK
jgi:hypothetical protein